ncbi:hypothetical protein MMCAP2_0471 [Mycoplasma mycoides subsp. capri str. GM12]|nr:hypothetical protein MMCAP2_0471 [Mycoplasma mycoides subsp. capri str. GM12]
MPTYNFALICICNAYILSNSTILKALHRLFSKKKKKKHCKILFNVI